MGEALEDVWSDPVHWEAGAAFGEVRFPTSYTDDGHSLDFPSEFPMLSPASYPSVTLMLVTTGTTVEVNSLAQSLDRLEYPNLELLVVDAAGDRELVEALTHLCPRVIAVPVAEGATLEGACNAAASLAEGEYLVFAPCEGSLEPNLVADLVRPLEFWSDIDWSVTTHDELYSPDYEAASANDSRRRSVRTDPMGVLFNDAFIAARRAAFEDGGGFQILPSAA